MESRSSARAIARPRPPLFCGRSKLDMACNRRARPAHAQIFAHRGVWVCLARCAADFAARGGMRRWVLLCFCWIGRLENATRAIFRKQREASRGPGSACTASIRAQEAAQDNLPLDPGPDSQPQASQFTASKLHAYAVSSSAANAAGAKLSALGVAQLARRKFAAPRANAATLPKADPHVPARAMPLAPPRAVPRRASPSRPRRHTI